MNDPRRAALQLLRDWHAAGLTHLPRASVLRLPGTDVPATPAVSPHATQTDSTSAESIPSDANPAFSSTSPVSTVSSAPSESMAKKRSSRSTASPPSAAPGASPVPSSSAPSSASRKRRAAQLADLAGCVAQCVRCRELAETRTQTVFGVGDPQARVMFIGEAPGADEDRLGEPFVGRAGQLLNKIIEACGWKREELYICNILRCRPPGNRTPSLEEAANCREYLDGQIAIVDPDYIVCWGTCAAQNLLATTETIGKMRQRFFLYNRAKVLCTYHPSYLLRNPAAKKPVWEDMKFLLQDMGITL